MQFNHRPGEVKIGEVSELMNDGVRTKMWEEIAKCDLVCANCHALRTHLRRRSSGWC